MDLMPPMRLPAPWTLEAYQPAGGDEDASLDVMPSRICLRRSGASGGTAPLADCTDLVMRSDTVGRETLPFQTIGDIYVAPIPDGHGGRFLRSSFMRQPAVVRMSRAGCSSRP
ncbi:hypothetical protein [Tanticharoenia sakaeratensis]|nr:hypothetical protein [Tanticharoenia sakaeratensis]